MSTSPTHFMQEALKVATEGLEKGELPIGAVVVLDGQIIARTHTAEIAEQRMLVHAELLALLMADGPLRGSLLPYPFPSKAAIHSQRKSRQKASSHADARNS
jgi:tRNA(adenine34) deaminase